MALIGNDNLLEVFLKINVWDVRSAALVCRQWSKIARVCFDKYIANVKFVREPRNGYAYFYHVNGHLRVSDTFKPNTIFRLHKTGLVFTGNTITQKFLNWALNVNLSRHDGCYDAVIRSAMHCMDSPSGRSWDIDWGRIGTNPNITVDNI